MKSDRGSPAQKGENKPPRPWDTDDAGRDTQGPRQVIEQAASDVAHGLVDTDLHGTQNDVPGPGPAPEDSPGAEVPREGVDRKNYSDSQTGGKGGGA